MDEECVCHSRNNIWIRHKKEVAIFGEPINNN